MIMRILHSSVIAKKIIPKKRPFFRDRYYTKHYSWAQISTFLIIQQRKKLKFFTFFYKNTSFYRSFFMSIKENMSRFLNYFPFFLTVNT